MNDPDRRNMLKWLGLGFVSIGAVGTLGKSALAKSTPPAPQPPQPITEPPPSLPDHRPWWLVAPYVEGSTIAGSQLVRMEPVTKGVVTLNFESPRGRHFQVHICKRGDGLTASPPPARTRRYDFLLANGGKGDKQTPEIQGKVVMACADAVRDNEMAAATLPLFTMRQRWKQLG